MDSLQSFLKTFKYTVLLIIVFLFPLFFLPITSEFFGTNKMYLLALGSLLLLAASTMELLTTKKLTWKKGAFDNSVLLFIIAIALAILISSPNKIQALLNPHFGFVSLLSLAVLYLYLSRSEDSAKRMLPMVFGVSTLVFSLITIVLFFQPFAKMKLPAMYQFLNNSSFNTIGTRFDLVIFLGFTSVFFLSQFLSRAVKRQMVLNGVILGANAVALGLSIYGAVKEGGFVFPPFTQSWYAAVEVLKSPLTALFGVGLDNYASMFTRVKDLAYNQSKVWQISSFNFARSTFLHVFTEAGLFGVISFILLSLLLLKTSAKKELGGFSMQHNPLILSTLYVILVLLLFPPSLNALFLLFFILSLVSIAAPQEKPEGHSFLLEKLLPLYLGIVIVSILFIGTSVYFLGRVYASEYYFKLAMDGYTKNDVKELYDNIQKSILINPFNERVRTNFSQANILIANNIASKVSQPASGAEAQPSERKTELTEQERQMVTQAVQAAIAEAKAVVTLNPQKAANWENLAFIYRNIISVAQGADSWTVSAYERAIVADPQNPLYRLQLGGLYYMLGNYDEASKLFEQSVGVKPDWANSHYNLAWAVFQKQNYQRAASEMQTVLTLVDPKANKKDYEQAQKDLEEFKKKLPKEEAKPATGEAAGEQQLTLPTPPEQEISPKIELPETASPEAN